eukprot:scaffold1220_cov259-Pinguiococcus_pyrenoidosus.AAC.94
MLLMSMVAPFRSSSTSLPVSSSSCATSLTMLCPPISKDLDMGSHASAIRGSRHDADCGVCDAHHGLDNSADEATAHALHEAPHAFLPGTADGLRDDARHPSDHPADSKADALADAGHDPAAGRDLGVSGRLALGRELAVDAEQRQVSAHAVADARHRPERPRDHPPNQRRRAADYALGRLGGTDHQTLDGLVEEISHACSDGRAELNRVAENAERSGHQDQLRQELPEVKRAKDVLQRVAADRSVLRRKCCEPDRRTVHGGQRGREIDRTAPDPPEKALRDSIRPLPLRPRGLLRICYFGVLRDARRYEARVDLDGVHPDAQKIDARPLSRAEHPLHVEPRRGRRLDRAANDAQRLQQPALRRVDRLGLGKAVGRNKWLDHLHQPDAAVVVELDLQRKKPQGQHPTCRSTAVASFLGGLGLSP